MFRWSVVFKHVISDHDWDRLVRCVTGECDPAEARETLRWINADADRARIAEELSALHRAGGTLARGWDVDVAWRKLGAPARPAPMPAFGVQERAGRRWSWVAQAAAAVLVVGAAAALARGALHGGRAVAPLLAEHVATTGPGQRATFQLPDGSRVMLGVGSTLRYRVGDAGPRQVVLEGEAYFDVVHDEHRPFVVRAGDLVAEDLGTEFVVRAYPEDRHARVVVRDGKVGLAGRIIGPGNLGRMSPSGEPVVESADTTLAFAWTTGTLVLDHASLRDALPELARWFDLDFQLADSTAGGRLVSATLVNQPTDDALAALARAAGVHHTRIGRVVTFSRAVQSQ